MLAQCLCAMQCTFELYGYPIVATVDNFGFVFSKAGQSSTAGGDGSAAFETVVEGAEVGLVAIS